MIKHVVVVVVCALLSTAASAYTVKPGELLIKGLTGASINVARLNVATKATPPAGMVLGVDLDWSFDGNWALMTSLRPVLSPGFIDGNLAVGARYRVLQLDAPLIPWASAQVVTALGAPLGYGDLHVNVGARVGGGVDYFVMRDLAVGVEVATEGSVLMAPLLGGEASTEVLVGVTWRL
ncbi:MAG: hypothetical protein Q8O67_05015 [Deltaproteobacteria bacterium]|nr:hypothetical protein [Deltaproteobacteria bacterium]